MAHTAESLQKWLSYLFPDEVPALKRLAQMLPPNPTVVNIGAGAGTSGLAFMESRPDLYLITIDIQDTASPLGSLASEEAVLREAGYWGQRNRQIHGDSKGVGHYWRGGKVDMVFVDGEHSYEGARGDIWEWLPNIKPGGIIAVHDYHKDKLFANETDYQDGKPHPQDWPGVTQAVDELLVGKLEQILLVDSLIAFRV